MDHETTTTVKNPFSQIAMIVFALVSLAHFLRLVLGWGIAFNGLPLPTWVSLVVCLLAAGLSFGLFRELRK